MDINHKPHVKKNWYDYEDMEQSEKKREEVVDQASEVTWSEN